VCFFLKKKIKKIIADDLKKRIFYAFKSQFFKNAIPNYSFYAFWFKIKFFIYKIIMPNTPLDDELSGVLYNEKTEHGLAYIFIYISYQNDSKNFKVYNFFRSVEAEGVQPTSTPI